MSKILVMISTGCICGAYNDSDPIVLNTDNIIAPDVTYLSLNSTNTSLVTEVSLPEGFAMGKYLYQNEQFISIPQPAAPVMLEPLTPEQIQGQFMVTQALQMAELQAKIDQILTKLGGS